MNNFQKLLIGAVIALIIINGILISVVWMRRPGHLKGARAPLAPRAKLEKRDFLRKELDLDRRQMKEFRELNQAHKRELRRLNLDIRKQKRALHRAVISQDSTQVQEILDTLTTKHRIIEEKMAEFLFAINNEADEKQRRKLLEILDKAIPPDTPPIPQE